MSAPRLLLVGVDLAHAGALSALAERHGLETVRAHDAAPSVSEHEAASLCVVGAGGDAAEARERVRAVGGSLPGVPIVVLVARADTDCVVHLMRLGVADVIGLPASPGDVAARALEHLRLPGRQVGRDAFIGSSPAATRLRQEISSVARTRSTVLITGETGTGKGLVARLIHRASDRRDGPLVHLDCASISPALIESELFGHERGAFTGATERRKGRFELARDGTVFLDEIGELELPLQTKLLRVLEEREYERVGSSRTLPMQARVIAATNVDLRDAIDAGSFRPDLYFRLNICRLHLPPLRARREDVPQLVRWALEMLGERLGVRVPRPTSGALKQLAEYDWPGNVRELISLLERLLVRGCGEVVEEQDLEEALRHEIARALAPALAAAGPRLAADLAPDPELDRSRVAAALRATGGNVARAARRLSLPRSTLRYRIKRYQLWDLIPDD